SQSQLPGVIRRMKQRLRRETRAKNLWAATEVLLGLRYPPDLVDVLLRGVMGMKESSTYQRILAEGRTEEAQRFLLALGQDKFGSPDKQARAVIVAITDVPTLEALGKRVRPVESWQE